MESGIPGQVMSVTKEAICIGTGKGQLCLKEIQLEGKKRMSTDAFLRGFEVLPGTMLG